MLSKQVTARVNTAFLIRTLFYWACFFYWEMIMRIVTIDPFFSWSIFRILFLCLPAALFAAALFTLIEPRFKKPVLLTLTIFLCVLYASQIVYRNIFTAFWVIGSLENGPLAMAKFFKKMMSTIIACTLWIQLCVLPVIAAWRFEKKTRPLYPQRVHIIYVIAAAFVINLFVWCSYIPAVRDKTSPMGQFYGRNSSVNVLFERSGLLGALGIQIASAIVPLGTDSAIDKVIGKTQEEIEAGQTTAPPDVVTDGPADPTEPPPPPPPVEYNMFDIDFEALAEEASNNRVKQLHEYIGSRTPSKKNEYTGMFEGYNLIFITAESFSWYAVDEELTPTLYKMMTQGFYFTDFYNPPWAVSTSDGEYVGCVGLFPKPDVWSFYRAGRENIWQPFTMGRQYEAMGAYPYAYHNNDWKYYHRELSHPNMGYDYKGQYNGLDVTKVWPQSDLEMMELSVDDYIHTEPFHAYYMTVSGHMEYNWRDNMMASRHRAITENMTVSERCKAYFACNYDLELAMTYLLERLREEGVADRTLIVIHPDHYPYGLTYDEISEFFGFDVERDVEVCQSALIMYVDGMTPVIVDKPCSDIDIIPTISNLLGLPFDSRLLMGTDILSDSPALVCFDSRSFITRMGTYYAKKNSFVPNEGFVIADGYRAEMSQIVAAKFSASEAILDLDYYRALEPYILAAWAEKYGAPEGGG